MIDERGGRGLRWGLPLPALLAALAVLAGCTATPGGAPAPSAQQAPPPAPPAACMLDTTALTTTTGLAWKPDHSTASDTRCVYDPATPAGAPPSASAPSAAGSIKPSGPDFVAVDVTRFTGDPAAELDVLAEVCEAGSRAPAPDGAGFVCRFLGGSVYAAVARNGRAITIAASAVPQGTTAARLVVAFTQQLGSLR